MSAEAEWMTLAEAAEVLGIGPKVMRDWWQTPCFFEGLPEEPAEEAG